MLNWFLLPRISKA